MGCGPSRRCHMRFDALSLPKARDLSTPPDDVILHIPGRVTAVFDGATDAMKRHVNGVPLGRAAAMAAAHAAAALPKDALDWPADRILGILSAAVGHATPADPDGGPGSTTAMIALEGHDHLRLLGLGDTGFRVNGGPVENTDLMPDRATIAGRVGLYLCLRERFGLEETELLSQLYLGRGLNRAIADAAITSDEAAAILDRAIGATDIPGAADEIAQLLSAGLQTQYRFANNPQARLGYGILNGYPPICSTAVDRTVAKSGLVSLELFSDGYLEAPDVPSIAAWEAAHERLEQLDPAHVAVIPSVKGSTRSHFFDDRSVVIMGFGD